MKSEGMNSMTIADANDKNSLATPWLILLKKVTSLTNLAARPNDTFNLKVPQ